MIVRVPIGVSDFRHLCERGLEYIDEQAIDGKTVRVRTAVLDG